MALIGLSGLVAIGLSLAGVETLSHLRDEPWKLPVLLSLGLLIPLIRSERSEEATLHLRSAPWVVAAVGLQFYAAAVGWDMGHRLALGLAGIGLLRMTRLASLPSSLLVAFAIPPPTVLAKWTHPELSSGLAHLGTAWMPEGTYLPGMASGFAVRLEPGDGGLIAAWLGAAVAVYAVRRRAHRAGSEWQLPEWGSLVLVGLAGILLTQLLALAIAAALASPLGPEAARGFLTFAPGLCVAGLGVLFVEAGLHAPNPSLPTGAEPAHSGTTP